MFWNNQTWTHGTDEIKIENGEVYRNREKIGKVDGDSLLIGDDKVTVHPYSKEVMINGKDSAYHHGDGSYTSRLDGTNWKKR